MALSTLDVEGMGEEGAAPEEEERGEGGRGEEGARVGSRGDCGKGDADRGVVEGEGEEAAMLAFRRPRCSSVNEAFEGARRGRGREQGIGWEGVM